MADKARVAAFKITGMDCADEVAVLKSAIGPHVGAGRSRRDSGRDHGRRGGHRHAGGALG